ncbi:hypothetical protein AVEN_183990-1 [Araneus ventricosus]|uniref:Uncharacterized protein n=1 Tax=Araneus ventricosus TaxID=182803 RepID=A0A4Y2E086_ARAVE|nr:hypothetical protein AVEN_183990-1 [Araneus ventricosus]
MVKEGTHSLRTVKRNRISNCKLRRDQEMKNKALGVSVEYCSEVDIVDVPTTSWKDNKIVNLASSFSGEQRNQRFEGIINLLKHILKLTNLLL